MLFSSVMPNIQYYCNIDNNVINDYSILIGWERSAVLLALQHECKLQMVSDWLKKKRNQRGTNHIRAVLVFRKQRFGFACKTMEHFKSIPKPKHSKPTRFVSRRCLLKANIGSFRHHNNCGSTRPSVADLKKNNFPPSFCHWNLKNFSMNFIFGCSKRYTSCRTFIIEDYSKNIYFCWLL